MKEFSLRNTMLSLWQNYFVALVGFIAVLAASAISLAVYFQQGNVLIAAALCIGGLCLGSMYIASVMYSIITRQSFANAAFTVAKQPSERGLQDV